MVYKPRATAMTAHDAARVYAIQSLLAVYTYTLWYVWVLTLTRGRFAVSVRFGLEGQLADRMKRLATVLGETHWKAVELMRLTVTFWNMASNSLASVGRWSSGSGTMSPARSSRPALNKAE